VQRELESCHDAEIPAAAANRPEQIRVLALADVDHFSCRRHQVRRHQIVDGHPELPSQPAEAAAKCEAQQLPAAERELEALRTILEDDTLKQTLLSPTSARSVLAIGPEVLAGEIAAARGQYDEAIARLSTAVRLEDALVYTEPSEWHYPPRLALGAVLLRAGRPLEAETVYWKDLTRNRENGWALFGLTESLKAQGRTAAARLAEERFTRAWSRVDVELSASRFGAGG
jgi:tetratricopeptide (TPR) repeat protein